MKAKTFIVEKIVYGKTLKKNTTVLGTYFKCLPNFFIAQYTSKVSTIYNAFHGSFGRGFINYPLLYIAGCLQGEI
jgi:hypothetical protein